MAAVIAFEGVILVSAAVQNSGDVAPPSDGDVATESQNPGDVDGLDRA